MPRTFVTSIAAILFVATFGRAQTCTSNTNSQFNLQAVYTTPPASGPTSVHLQILSVNAVPMQSWAVLTAGTSTAYTYDFMSSGVLSGYLPSNVNQHTTGIPLAVGETPTFVSIYPYYPGWPDYCLMESSDGESTLLAASGSSNEWALCSNSTANDRLDVVFSPIANHPHYNIDSCLDVTIELIS